MRYKHTIRLVNGDTVTVENNDATIEFAGFGGTAFVFICDNDTTKHSQIPLTAILMIESHPTP